MLNNYHISDRFFQLYTIRKFIRAYAKKDNWHNLDFSSGNLGYGWIHYALIRNLKPKKILVVGSKYGFIPAVCAIACRDNRRGKVDFVDAGYDVKDKRLGESAWGGAGAWKKRGAQSVFGQFNLNRFIEAHIMTTKDFLSTSGKKTWDYVYLDGDHSYSGINHDFHAFYPRINSPGYLAIHDIFAVGKNGQPYGVSIFWNKLQNSKKYNLLEIPGKFGLGILQNNSGPKRRDSFSRRLSQLLS